MYNPSSWFFARHKREIRPKYSGSIQLTIVLFKPGDFNGLCETNLPVTFEDVIVFESSGKMVRVELSITIKHRR